MIATEDFINDFSLTNPAKPALYDAFGIAGGNKETCKEYFGIGIKQKKYSHLL